MSGWLTEQTNCLECVQPYWNYRDEMTVQNGLILKGTRIVIPKQMKINLLERLQKVILVKRNVSAEREQQCFGLVLTNTSRIW